MPLLTLQKRKKATTTETLHSLFSLSIFSSITTSNKIMKDIEVEASVMSIDLSKINLDDVILPLGDNNQINLLVIINSK